MAQITVLDSAGVTQTVAKVINTGSGAAADSLGVTASTEDVARVGAVAETAPASDTASSGLNGRLQRIAQNLTTLTSSVVATNTQLPATPSGVGSATLTRPANTTAYTAGDVIGAAAAAFTLATGLTLGQRAILTSMDLRIDIAAVPSGMATFRVHLYSVTPPSALADNAAFDLPSGDRASYLGYVTLTAPVDLGATCFSQVDGINKQIQLSGSSDVFGYLETVGAFTPAAVSEVYTLRAHFLGQ
jgi:hypothetical protein